MDYKSIRQTVHMSRSTETPETVAEREYRQRLNGWSTFRSGITLRGSELFVVNFRELATITDSIRDQENKVAELWNALLYSTCFRLSPSNSVRPKTVGISTFCAYVVHSLSSVIYVVFRGHRIKIG